MKKYLLLFTVIINVNIVVGQSDNEAIGSKYYLLFNRLDIKLRNDSILGFSTFKPFSKKTITERLEYLNRINDRIKFSRIDLLNIKTYLQDNSEWTKDLKDSLTTRGGLCGKFYKNPTHLYEVNTDEFTLRIEPVLNLLVGNTNDESKSIYQNTRGILVRGNVYKQVGFYTYLTDNQERDPTYVQNWVSSHHAVPGVGFYKPYKNKGYDYFDMKGGISFKTGKYFNAQFAYDKLFIGNGYRSLFLSDFSNNFLFFRLSTRLWKFNYEMVIAQTIQSVPQVGREMKPKNYMAIHHLSTQVSKWLNLGIYENIMEDGKYGLQLSYLNPVIFYRATESNLGAAGKANIGIDLKANVNRSLQLYSQLLINEFHIHEIIHYGDGAFVNKQALQLGLKYIDLFGIPNLDVQSEINLVRPFTYTNFDSVTNLTHYNQPMAHPLGANFKEFISIINYQPTQKINLEAKTIYYLQGLDSIGTNTGYNIFRGYDSRSRDYGYFIGSGIPVKSFTFVLNGTFEFSPNMFLCLALINRNYNIQNGSKSNFSSFSIGLRINATRRNFDF